MNTSEDKIQIFRALPKLSPYLEFGKVAKAVELYAQDADTYRVQIIELDRGKSFEPHIHVSDHIIYCLDGNGKINIWNHEEENPIKVIKSSKKSYPFSRGDLAILPKNVIHAFEASEQEYLKEMIINIPGISLHDERRIVWV